MRSMVVVALSFAFACDKAEKPTTPSNPTGSAGSSTDSSPKAGSASFTGRAESEPCNDVKECVLRDNCGCSCEAVLATASKQVKCDETCGMDACAGYTLICDTAMHRCGAIPKAPPSLSTHL